MATETVEPKRIGVRDLLEAGLHFGHQTKRWNPKMRRYIFDKRNGIHIIDLAKSLVHLNAALEFLHEVVVSGKSILFVGTKKQAREIVRETAESSGQHFVNTRWLGGTLTNSATIRKRVRRLRELEEMEKENGFAGVPKKEAAVMRHELEKLRRNLAGIARMESLPGAMFVVDITREGIAVKEANRLGIPVVAIVDTNCDPDPIDYPIPGNDDAIRAIKLICGAVQETVKSSNEEYGRVAAEIARKKDEDRKESEKLAAERRAASPAEVSGEHREGRRPARRRRAEGNAQQPQAAAPAAPPVQVPETPAQPEAPVAAVIEPAAGPAAVEA